MNTNLLRAALAVALTTICAAAATAPASAADMRYSVDVTGIQVTDWSYQSEVYPDELTGWSKNWGTQTLGFSTPTKYVFEAFTLPESIPGAPSWILQGPLNQPKVKATVSRKATVTHKDGLPVCEGSNLDPECLFVPLPGSTKQTGCGRKTPRMGVTFDLPDKLAGAIVVEPAVIGTFEYAKCAPDHDALVETDQLEATFAGSLKKWRALRVGQTLKLRHEAQSTPGCPLPSPARNQLDTCVVTDITVEITRTR